MMGHFKDKNFAEFNIKCDIPAARKYIAEWPTPIVASPYELGDAILYPASSIENDFQWLQPNPLVEGYKAYLQMPYDRQTWDLTSLLYVVERDKKFFNSSGPGTIVINDEGTVNFIHEINGKHSFLTVTDAQAQAIKEYFIELITRKPKKYSNL